MRFPMVFRICTDGLEPCVKAIADEEVIYKAEPLTWLPTEVVGKKYELPRAVRRFEVSTAEKFAGRKADHSFCSFLLVQADDLVPARSI